MPELFYAGSVKNLYVEEHPTDACFGRGYMRFEGDDFSVFDKGKMPWPIDGHGEDLWRCTLRFRDVLHEAGIPTHFRKGEGYRTIDIHLARQLGYDDIVPGESAIYRIPMECVFTHILTPVASLHRRLRTGAAKLEDYGLDRPPKKGETVILPNIATSFSTKIDPGSDEYKGLKKMAELSGLVGSEASRLNDLTIACAEALVRDAEQAGFLLADGKFEFIMGHGRNFLVGDTGYTIDENRALVELPGGRLVDISKQFPRDIYTINGYKARLKAAQEKWPDNQKEWPEPPPADEEAMGLAARASHAFTSAVMRKSGSREMLVGVAKEIANYLDRLKDMHDMDNAGETP